MGNQRRLFAALAGAMLASASSAATIRSVAFEPAGETVRVVVDFDEAFPAPSTFALDGPRRLVVDLPESKTDTKSFEGQGLAAQARTAQFSADRARIVIDLASPATLEGASAADNRLTLTLRPSEASAFGKLVAKGRTKLPGSEIVATAQADKLPAPAEKPPASAEKAATPADRPPVQTAAKPGRPERPAVEKALPVKAEAKAPTQMAAVAKPRPAPVRTPVRPGNRPLVVLDAGHGGHDVGAIGVWEQRREKDATLAIAHAIRRELESTGRFRVLMTRSDDRFLPLGQRVAIAQRAKADLFISVHADSAPVPEARGATVYTLSEVASDREAARLAAKENRSDVLAGFHVPVDNIDVADILIDLAQRETMNVSAGFAATLQREMGDKVRFRSYGHRFAGFRVLKAPDVPSVLLETGYMSNEDDARYLFSEAGQKAIAEGVREAVEAHFHRRIAQR